MMLRGESVKFSKQTAKQNRAQENQLIKEIEYHYHTIDPRKQYR